MVQNTHYTHKNTNNVMYDLENYKFQNLFLLIFTQRGAEVRAIQSKLKTTECNNFVKWILFMHEYYCKDVLVASIYYVADFRRFLTYSSS